MKVVFDCVIKRFEYKTVSVVYANGQSESIPYAQWNPVEISAKCGKDKWPTNVFFDEDSRTETEIATLLFEYKDDGKRRLTIEDCGDAKNDLFSWFRGTIRMCDFKDNYSYALIINGEGYLIEDCYPDFGKMPVEFLWRTMFNVNNDRYDMAVVEYNNGFIQFTVQDGTQEELVWTKCESPESLFDVADVIVKLIHDQRHDYVCDWGNNEIENYKTDRDFLWLGISYDENGYQKSNDCNMVLKLDGNTLTFFENVGYSGKKLNSRVRKELGLC